MLTLEPLEIRNGICRYRPHGKRSLVEVVDLIIGAIAHCRERGVDKLLINTMGLDDILTPSLVDRFLMVEEWALEAKGTVVVVLVTPPECIHPRKFGVTVALHFGLVCNVFTSDEPALQWLLENAPPTEGDSMK